MGKQRCYMRIGTFGAMSLFSKHHEGAVCKGGVARNHQVLGNVMADGSKPKRNVWQVADQLRSVAAPTCPAV